MARNKETSQEAEEENPTVSRISKIIGLMSIIIGGAALVLSQTYYDDNLAFLMGGILLIIIGSVSVLLS